MFKTVAGLRIYQKWIPEGFDRYQTSDMVWAMDEIVRGCNEAGEAPSVAEEVLDGEVRALLALAEGGRDRNAYELAWDLKSYYLEGGIFDESEP